MKKIYKSHTDRKLCGVCGGIAQTFELDPNVVRVLWAISSIFYGVSIALYIICAFILPYNEVEAGVRQIKLCRSHSDRKLFGVCGGIAEYLDIRSSIVRDAFVLFSFMFGTGILVYILLIALIPDELQEI